MKSWLFAVPAFCTLSTVGLSWLLQIKQFQQTFIRKMRIYLWCSFQPLFYASLTLFARLRLHSGKFPNLSKKWFLTLIFWLQSNIPLCSQCSLNGGVWNIAQIELGTIQLYYKFFNFHRVPLGKTYYYPRKDKLAYSSYFSPWPALDVFSNFFILKEKSWCINKIEKGYHLLSHTTYRKRCDSR